MTYKAVENLDGFRRWLGVASPNLLAMVFVFGLIHGFGLSTRLQEMTLAKDPELVQKILAFNVGVELGQIAALTAMTAVVSVWRTSAHFPLMQSHDERRADRGKRGAARRCRSTAT